jgi:alginate O-acetyltransferase complex protein AlgI
MPVERRCGDLRCMSIIDFWRRWHMTLSQFLRDYIPLGGNRGGPARRYVNLMITMGLGGLWRGAAWTFIAWGALHGVHLCINHAWNRFGPPVAPQFSGVANVARDLSLCGGRFRADSIRTAIAILSRMADPTRIAGGYAEVAYLLFIGVFTAIAWFAPNTQSIMGYDSREEDCRRNHQHNVATLGPYLSSCRVLVFGILSIQKNSEFIYFRF